MLISMTGFGKKQVILESGKFIITIKTLNSKQTDIYTRLPQCLKDYDIELRGMLIEQLVRGKIDLTIEREQNIEQPANILNVPLIENYYTQLQQLATQYNVQPSAELLTSVLRLPDTIRTDKEEIGTADFHRIRSGVTDAIHDVIAFRKKEGAALEHDIREKIATIHMLLKEIDPYEKQRTDSIRNRITKQMLEGTQGNGFDKDRFEQEMIYFLEKMDITEEKVRLASHCSYFTETLDADSGAGKKLGFIAQEMTREINTIGSKANDFNIQCLVVQMKDEVEKVKEQLMNIL